MTKEETIERAKRLKGLMPKMTDDQVMEVADLIRAHDTKNVDAAITGFTRGNEDFNLAAFLKLLPTRGETDGSWRRTQEYLDQQKREADQINAQWAAARAYVDGLATEELLRRRDAALATLPTSEREWELSQIKSRQTRIVRLIETGQVKLPDAVDRVLTANLVYLIHGLPHSSAAGTREANAHGGLELASEVSTKGG